MAASIIIVVLLGVVLLLGGAGAGVFFLLRRQKEAGLQEQARQADFVRRAQSAVWAGATIVNVRTASIGEQTQSVASARLLLQIRPPQGDPYTASATWLVELPVLSGLQPGAELSVKIDAEDPLVIYPNLSGARYLGK